MQPWTRFVRKSEGFQSMFMALILDVDFLFFYGMASDRITSWTYTSWRFSTLSCALLDSRVICQRMEAVGLWVRARFLRLDPTRLFTMAFVHLQGSPPWGYCRGILHLKDQCAFHSSLEGHPFKLYKVLKTRRQLNVQWIPVCCLLLEQYPDLQLAQASLPLQKEL